MISCHVTFGEELYTDVMNVMNEFSRHCDNVAIKNINILSILSPPICLPADTLDVLRRIERRPRLAVAIRTVIKISLPRARSPPVVCTIWIYSSAPACFNLCERWTSLKLSHSAFAFLWVGLNQHSARCPMSLPFLRARPTAPLLP